MLFEAKHDVEILHGLTGRAFAQIVQAGNDDESSATGVQRETDIAEIGLDDVLQLGLRASGPQPNHGPASVKLTVDLLDLSSGL